MAIASKYKGLVQTEIGLLPEQWKVDKLENHLIIKGRIGWKGLAVSEYTEEGPFIVGGLQIENNGVIWKECAHVTEERYNESPEIMLREQDILMTKDGTIGKLAYVDWLPGKATVASHIHVIRKKSEEILPKFLFYFFRSPIFQSIIGSKISGSVVPALIQRDINSTFFPLPPLAEQDAITQVLSNLDSKIFLNQHMNRTLEAFGQAVFKRWFVDFEFPYEEGKPYKSNGGSFIGSEGGKISMGWETGRLGDICEITMGQSPPGETYNETEEGVPFFQGIRDFGFRFPSKRVYCTAATRFAKESDILLSVRAPVGSLNIAQERCAIGRGVAAIRLKGKQNGFLYYLLLSTRSAWDKYESKGTVFGSATKQDVNDFQIVIPPKDLRDQFGELVEPLDKRILLNEKASRTLTAVRDSLLPRLMSGKIRVPVPKENLEAQ